MAFKPIVEIEIDDAAFRRFYELFQTYSAKLEEMPKAWQELNEHMNESGDALKSGALDAKNMLAIAAAQAGVIAEELGRATKAQDHLTHATHKGSQGMEKLKKSAKGVSEAIAMIGGGIVKIAAFGGIGALLGGFGMDSLANTAFSRFRAAGQLGLSPALLASFQTNAQQFLSTSALEAAANAQIDIRKAGSLAALGIDYRTAQGMNPSDLAFEELKRARAAYLLAQKNHQPAANMPAIAAYLALGGSIGDVRNAAMQPLSVLDAAQAATRRDVSELGFSRATAQSWANLKIILDKAGLTIESSLIRSLSGLGKPIGMLAKDFAGLISQIVGSKGFKNAVVETAHELTELGTFLKSKEFQADWKAIGADVKAFGRDVVAALRFLNLIPGKGKKNETLQQHLSDWFWGRGQGKGIKLSSLPGDFGNWLGKDLGRPIKSGISGAIHAVASVAMKDGVDPVLALATAMHESGLNPRAVGDKGTSFGLFQLHRGGELGSLSRRQAFNASTNAGRALREFRAVEHLSASALLHRFSAQVRNDPTDRLASHADIMRLVGTPGEVAAVAQRPADPLGYAEKINKLYTKIDQKLRMSNKPLHVSIHNHTAAHVSTSVHATAQ